MRVNAQIRAEMWDRTLGVTADRQRSTFSIPDRVLSLHPVHILSFSKVFTSCPSKNCLRRNDHFETDTHLPIAPRVSLRWLSIPVSAGGPGLPRVGPRHAFSSNRDLDMVGDCSHYSDLSGVRDSKTETGDLFLTFDCLSISRTLTLGSIRKLQPDDWIMLVALCTYTTLIVTINIVANSTTNLLPPHFDLSSLTPDDQAKREFGSKLVLVVEQCQILTV